MEQKSVTTMIAVKQAVVGFCAGLSFPVRVQAVLGPEGPEVHVLVEPGNRRKLRLLLPVNKSGIPVIVKVVPKI